MDIINRALSVSLIVVLLQGCVNEPVSTDAMVKAACVGSPQLTGALAGKFDETEDEALLSQALGEPLQGKLCQGVVYQSNTSVTLYRAWNSTNPGSRLGQWWALSEPSGPVAAYREDYEICYQWSPLDKLVKCTLKAGTRVVVGNGQSARCSDYLSYPVSEQQQLFIADAASAVVDCEEFDAVMTWQ